jgi:predicted transcriptional regulator
MAVSAKRSFAIKINLTPELHERLREVAAQLGQTPGTCASMAVGQFVRLQESTASVGKYAADSAVAAFGPEFKQLMLLAARGEE